MTVIFPLQRSAAFRICGAPATEYHGRVQHDRPQNCPVRENKTWAISGFEREFAPIGREKDVTGLSAPLYWVGVIV
jgi:hypothetical protein